MADPLEVVIQALDAHDCRPRGNATKGFEARCPAHDDRNPSLSVTTGSDGRALLHCHAGCGWDRIVDELGLEAKALFPEGTSERDIEWTPVAEFDYKDAEGHRLFKVVRFPGKQFRQARWEGGEWRWGMEGVTRQLYRLPQVLEAKERGDYIVLCEGEKDAEAVVKADMCATTMPGGAGKWEPQYTDTLTGAKVLILADDDEPGQKHAAWVARELYGKAAMVGWRLPAEGCKDIAAHLAKGLSLNGDLRRPPAAVVPGAPSRGGALSAKLFAATRKRRDRTVLGPLFQRASRTVIGAQTGEGKTTLALQAVQSLVTGEPFLQPEWKPKSQASRALIVDLEQGEATLRKRLVEAGLDTSERVDILWEPSGIALDSREEDRAWVHDALREGGYDLVVFDPLYQLHLGSGNDELVAARVMNTIDEWVREFDCSFVVPMHMRKPHPEAKSRVTKHDIAGSGTWLRPCEVVLGLQVMSPGASRLHFFKDRDGEGPELNSHWWLSFKRDEGGFARTYKEERDRINARVRELLKSDLGATMTQLVEATEGSEELLQKALASAHELNGRYRKKPWVGAIPGQTALEA